MSGDEGMTAWLTGLEADFDVRYSPAASPSDGGTYDIPRWLVELRPRAKQSICLETGGADMAGFGGVELMLEGWQGQLDLVIYHRGPKLSLLGVGEGLSVQIELRPANYAGIPGLIGSTLNGLPLPDASVDIVPSADERAFVNRYLETTDLSPGAPHIRIRGATGLGLVLGVHATGCFIDASGEMSLHVTDCILQANGVSGLSWGGALRFEGACSVDQASVTGDAKILPSTKARIGRLMGLGLDAPRSKVEIQSSGSQGASLALNECSSLDVLLSGLSSELVLMGRASDVRVAGNGKVKVARAAVIDGLEFTDSLRDRFPDAKGRGGTPRLDVEPQAVVADLSGAIRVGSIHFATLRGVAGEGFEIQAYAAPLSAGAQASTGRLQGSIVQHVRVPNSVEARYTWELLHEASHVTPVLKETPAVDYGALKTLARRWRLIEYRLVLRYRITMGDVFDAYFDKKPLRRGRLARAVRYLLSKVLGLDMYPKLMGDTEKLEPLSRRKATAEGQVLSDSVYMDSLARVVLDRGAPGSVCSRVNWTRYRIRQMLAARPEKALLALYRLLGYGERPGPPLAIWFAAVCGLTAWKLHKVSSGGASLGVHQVLDEAARWITPSIGVLTLPQLPSVQYNGFDYLAHALLAIPLITGILALRKILKT